MQMRKLEVPSDPNAELYFDAKRLVVDFRQKQAKKAETGVKVLRVVIQYFGWVIEDRFFEPGTVITVGTGKRNTFRIPTKDLPDEHPLLQYGPSGEIQLSVNQHFGGLLQMGEQLRTLADARGSTAKPMYNLDLAKGTRGCLELGALHIYFEEESEPEKVPPVAIFKNYSDPYMTRWLVLSLILHFILLLVIWFMPKPTTDVTLEDLSPKFRKILVEPQKIAAYVPKVMAAGQAGLSRGAQGQEGEGERAPGPEGRRGKGVPGATKRMTGRDISKTGVLDVLARSGKRGALADLIGGGSALPGEVDRAMNRKGRYGLPGETELREGKGLQGTGTGGGGLSTSIGQGLGTKGRGGGAKGSGLADFGSGRSDVAVSASIDSEDVYIVGNIPREVIAKIINDNIGRIKYCYERQLQVQPKLAGKILVEWVIGLEGRVTSTRLKSSSMGSPPVEQCVQGVIRTLPFPKPGGGVVQVTYPFLFRVAG